MRQVLRNTLGLKGNLDILPGGNLFAEALGRRSKPQVLQFRGMQEMRQCLNIAPEFRYSLTTLFDAALCGTLRSRKTLLHSLQMHSQQRNALSKIVMQFSRNPCAFLLLGFNQLPAYT